MGSKYREYQSPKGPTREEMRRIHPVWRGVGCALMLLMPVISWAAQDVIISRKLVPLPMDLLAGPGDFLYQFFPDPYIHIRLLFAVGLLLVLYAVLMLITFIMNQSFGITPRTDPFYVPPVQARKRRP